MKYRAEVEVADGSPSVWYSNALRFDSPEEAKFYVDDLAARWTSVKRARVVEDSVPEKEAVDPTDERIVLSYA